MKNIKSKASPSRPTRNDKYDFLAQRNFNVLNFNNDTVFNSNNVLIIDNVSSDMSTADSSNGVLNDIILNNDVSKVDGCILNIDQLSNSFSVLEVDYNDCILNVDTYKPSVFSYDNASNSFNKDTYSKKVGKLRVTNDTSFKNDNSFKSDANSKKVFNGNRKGMSRKPKDARAARSAEGRHRVSGDLTVMYTNADSLLNK